MRLVLGAGNVSSIPPLDVLYALYAHGSVVMLKLNPVNAYLKPVFARIFSSLVDEGYVRIADGGAAVGRYLCEHPGINAIHLTGREQTHDVTPVIVVPGPWSKSDLAFQAANVATMKLHNAGANCIAAQVLVAPAAWDCTPRFLQSVRTALREAPQRPSYYPGSAERVRGAEHAHRSAERVNVPVDGVHRLFVGGLDPANADEPLFRGEAFGPVLAQTELPGDDAAPYLRHAIAFCNDRLRGTLGCSILIHPRTIRELGAAFEDLIAELRYGCVAINTWPGVGYSLATASWGAYPGNTVAHVESGIGVVHNAYLFDKPQKTVVRAPFAPFPRSLGDGERTLLPTPPWFVTHRRADAVGRKLFGYAAKPSPLRMAAAIVEAIRA